METERPKPKSRFYDSDDDDDILDGLGSKFFNLIGRTGDVQRGLVNLLSGRDNITHVPDPSFQLISKFL